MVCSPKDLGGLGFPDLKILGFALRLHWEWFRHTGPPAPWAGLPCRPEHMVDAMFRASVHVQLGDGKGARVWTDTWLSSGPICLSTLALF